jgi:hypothetical protein
MGKENIQDMSRSTLIEYISQLEKENNDLVNTFNETSHFLVNYGELSRSVLHANEIIDNAGGWNMLKPENIEEICAAICHAAMRIEVGKSK